MENETMNNVELNDVIEVVGDECQGFGLGKCLLIGGIIVGGTIVAVKTIKKVVKLIKSKTDKKTDGAIHFKDIEKNDEENVTE